MLIKSKSSFRLIFGWPILAILLSFVAIAPVHSEQFHYNRNGGVILPSRHTDPFTKFFEDTIKHVVDTGINQVKSIVSGTKNLVTAAGQIIASVLAYATGNKELGDKLANDAASSAKHLGNDATDLLASGGDLYNKTAEDLNEVVPHLGTLAGMLVSFTPIGPEVALARGFADIKNAFENGGINAALQAAAFAAIDVAPGGAGKAAKAAKEAIAAEKAGAALGKLSALIKQVRAETKVAGDAAKLNKFLDYLDKVNKILRPKDFVPDRGRDKDGKLQGTGGSNWEDRRDAARKMTGYDELKAKAKTAQEQAAINRGVDRPRNEPEPPALRFHGRARLDSVAQDEPAPPAPDRDAEQVTRNSPADLTKTQRPVADHKRKPRQQTIEAQKPQSVEEKEMQPTVVEKTDGRKMEAQHSEPKQQPIEDGKPQPVEEEKQQPIADDERPAHEEKRQHLEDEKPQRLEEEKQQPIADDERPADEENRPHLEDEKPQPVEKEEKQPVVVEKTDDQKMEAPHSEDEEVQAQADYLSKLRAEKEQQAKEPKQSAPSADDEQPEQSKDEDSNE